MASLIQLFFKRCPAQGAELHFVRIDKTVRIENTAESFLAAWAMQPAGEPKRQDKNKK